MATKISRNVVPLFLVLSALACQTQNNDEICDPKKMASACAAGFKCDEVYANETFLTCIPIENGNADGGFDAEPKTPVDGKLDTPSPDADAVDLGINVAPPECDMDRDCVGKAGGPVCTKGSCAPCKSSVQCGMISPTQPLCETQNGLCVECIDNTACAGKPGRELCDKSTGMCVGCKATADCMPFASTRPECAVDTGACVECLGHAQCATKAGRPVCEAKTGTCVKCGDSSECATAKPAQPVCSETSGDCVECLGPAHCRGKLGTPICSSASQSCVRCSASADCAAASSLTPICIVGTGECMECGADTDCTDSTKPLCGAGVCVACDKAQGKTCDGRPNTPKTCDATTGRCEECVGNTNCTSLSAPLCKNKKCVPCEIDSECVARNGADPGVCLASGACATDEDVVYVQRVAACTESRGQGGTRAKPYCDPSDAFSSLTANRSTILIRGPAFGINYAGVPGTLNIVGQDNASMTSVFQTGGILNLRDLQIGPSLGKGIETTGVATLNADRLLVVENSLGGIVTKALNGNAPNFDIRNTIIAKNGDGTSVTPGGLVLAVTNGVHRLTHVTVFDNNGPGIICSNDIQAVGIIASDNRFGDDSPQCGIPVCCTGNPMLTADYHLTSGSMCIDKVPANMSLPLDIDGNARPQGTASDCGADEFVP